MKKVAPCLFLTQNPFFTLKNNLILGNPEGYNQSV